MPLRDFAGAAWHVLEPETPFIPNWHLDCIADHLEACTRGELLNLVINIPPRHMKSLSVAVFWPCWEWTFRPHIRWLFNSYAEGLSVRDSLKSRRLILSPWYQARYGDRFQLTGDQNQKTRFENDRTGYRIATSVKGSNTGEGGDRLVADDPHNAREGESDAERETVKLWWDEVMPSRRNNLRTAVRVIVMQRVHQDDVSGHVLAEKKGYHHLCLPEEWEPRVQVQVGSGYQPQPHDDCAIAVDPRTEPGELLWPGRLGAGDVAEAKTDLGPYGYAGQYQQRPTPRAGALFRDEWFRALPPDWAGRRLWCNAVQFWDLSWTEAETSDWVAGATIHIDPRGQELYLTGLARFRTTDDSEADDELLIAQAETTGITPAGPGDAPAEPWMVEPRRRTLAWRIARNIAITRPGVVGVEEGAFQQAATKDLLRRIRGYLWAWSVAVVVVSVKVTKDKVFRAQLPSGRLEEGVVYADRSAPWWPTFIGELLAFPKGSYDDQVDALSGATQLAIEKGRRLSREGTPLQIVGANGEQVDQKDPTAVPRAHAQAQREREQRAAEAELAYRMAAIAAGRSDDE